MLRQIQVVVDSETNRIEAVQYDEVLVTLKCLPCEKTVGMVVDNPRRLLLCEYGGPDGNILIDRVFEIVPAPDYGAFIAICRHHGELRFEEGTVVAEATEALAGRRPADARLVGIPVGWDEAKWQSWTDSKNRPARQAPGIRRLRSVS